MISTTIWLIVVSYLSIIAKVLCIGMMIYATTSQTVYSILPQGVMTICEWLRSRIKSDRPERKIRVKQKKRKGSQRYYVRGSHRKMARVKSK
jgi:hypothetical protein